MTRFLVTLFVGLSLFSAPALAQDPAAGNEDTYEIAFGEEVQAQTKHFYYDFGRTLINTTKSVRFYLRNQGRFPIYINDIDTDGNGFWDNENCPSLLWPGQRCSIRVFFRPQYLGTFLGQTDISLTGSEDIRVHLRGRGVWGF